MIGHRIGYVLVSSFDQNPERQLENIQVDKLFTDSASGKDSGTSKGRSILAIKAVLPINRTKLLRIGIRLGKPMRKMFLTLKIFSPTCKYGQNTWTVIKLYQLKKRCARYSTGKITGANAFAATITFCPI